jgi:hydroxymethylpyrimidine/phosphomethylpyrimidine kinase
LKIALSIAGSDSGGGAGIQADLKTFSALGVYGCTAITAITAQNTKQVAEIVEISPTMVERQIKSVMIDMPPDVIKIGMVYSNSIIDAIYRSLRGINIPIVLDPVFSAGTGADLIRSDAYSSFISKLISKSTLITPNRMEAEKLAGMIIRTEDAAIEAARKIKEMGAENVIVKGGHFGSNHVTDLLLDRKGDLMKFTNPRLRIKESHGSGCNFSSAVAAFVAKEIAIHDACKMATEYIYNALKNIIRIGHGLPVANPISIIHHHAQCYVTLLDLQNSVEQICKLDSFYRLIPESQTNFVYALPDALKISEVAGVRGRIVKVVDSASPTSYIEFAASSHVASAVIAYMRVNPIIRSAINIRYDERIVKVCKSLFSVSSYDRTKEPTRIKREEGSSVTWGTLVALSKNHMAEAIYHKGDIGKEPMMTIFGRNPTEVVTKIKAILKGY